MIFYSVHHNQKFTNCWLSNQTTKEKQALGQQDWKLRDGRGLSVMPTQVVSIFIVTLACEHGDMGTVFT